MRTVSSDTCRRTHRIRTPTPLMYLLLIVMIVLGGTAGSHAAVARQVPSDTGEPSISLRKLTCVPYSGTTSLPVFVEDACTQVDSGAMKLTGPSQGSIELSLGELDPDRSGPWMPAQAGAGAPGGASVWSIDDLTPPSGTTGNVRSMLSCLSTAFSAEGLPTTVKRVIYTQNRSGVAFDWHTVGGSNSEPFAPNLQCDWFALALPEEVPLPGVLQIQTQPAIAALLRTQEANPGRALYDTAIPDDAADMPELTADMRLVNSDTGAEITFEADARGQVIVPAGEYVLIDEDTGNESPVRMEPGQTALAVVGIPTDAALGDITPPASGEGFGLGAVTAFCEPGHAGPFVGCEPWEGVEIDVDVERGDDSYTDSCVTGVTSDPAEARVASCDFEVPFATTVTASIDEFTIPEGYVLKGVNPQRIEIPATPPDGVFGGPVFVLLPADSGDGTPEGD